jgi:hypothetical protein
VRSEGHALLARRAPGGHDPRQEPDVVVPRVRIYARGGS